MGVGGTFFFLADETSERIRLVEPCFWNPQQCYSCSVDWAHSADDGHTELVPLQSLYLWWCPSLCTSAHKTTPIINYVYIRNDLISYLLTDIFTTNQNMVTILEITNCTIRIDRSIKKKKKHLYRYTCTWTGKSCNWDQFWAKFYAYICQPLSIQPSMYNTWLIFKMINQLPRSKEAEPNFRPPRTWQPENLENCWSHTRTLKHTAIGFSWSSPFVLQATEINATFFFFLFFHNTFKAYSKVKSGQIKSVLWLIKSSDGSVCVCVRVGDGGDMWDDSVEFLFQSRLQFKSGRVLFHSSQHVPPLIALMPCWVSSSFSSLAEAANFITLKTYTALLEVVGNREKLF